MSENRSRINYIDALKGFTIILVVLGHIGNGYMWDDGASKIYFFLYNIPNAFHMPLFMILSGFVFHKAYCSGPGGTLKKDRLIGQIINLAIIYVLWSMLLVFFKIIFSSFVNIPATWTDLLMIPIKPPQLYWYLFILIIYYALFALLHKLRVNIYLLLVITLCISIVSFFVPPSMIFDVKRLLYHTLHFTVGIALAMYDPAAYKKNTRIFFRVLLIALVAAAVFFSIYCWDYTIFLHDRFIISVVIGLGLSLGCYMLFQYIPWLGNSSFFRFFGKHCLEIYLMHTFFITAVRGLFYRLGIYSVPVHIIACLIGGIAVPLGIVFLFKKIRIYDIFFSPYRFITNLKKRKKADA